MDQELECLKKLNPALNVVIYTLDFKVAAEAADKLRALGIRDVETIQISVSRLDSKNAFKPQPAPWIITGRS